MKPVIIQNLIKNNKGKYKATPVTEKDIEQHDKAMGTFVFWFVVCLVIAGLVID